jgi:hypothetical protein
MSATKWVPQGLGATPKKTATLIVLGLVLAGVAYNNFSGDDYPVATAPRPAAAPNVGTVTTAVQTPGPAVRTTARTTARPSSRGKSRGGSDEFKPSVLLPEDIDLTKIDPTVRTDLLARVRGVGNVGGSRSLFEFYTPPPPPPPKQAPIIPKPPAEIPKPVESKPAVAVKPPPPPIPLKYFGYQGEPRNGKMRALFVDPQGETPYVAGVNDMIRSRYRVVRIGTTSAELEDTVEKNTQTLRIADRQDP